MDANKQIIVMLDDTTKRNLAALVEMQGKSEDMLVREGLRLLTKYYDIQEMGGAFLIKRPDGEITEIISVPVKSNITPLRRLGIEKRSNSNPLKPII